MDIQTRRQTERERSKDRQTDRGIDGHTDGHTTTDGMPIAADSEEIGSPEKIN